MWYVSGFLFLAWLILKFVLHKSGFIHILLIGSISVFVVQLMAYRKTRYQRKAAEDWLDLPGGVGNNDRRFRIKKK